MSMMRFFPHNCPERLFGRPRAGANLRQIQSALPPSRPGRRKGPGGLSRGPGSIRPRGPCFFRASGLLRAFRAGAFPG